MSDNIRDIIESHTSIKLVRRGVNLVGLCPFHTEKTPSFTVFPHTNSFYCFGCCEGGDSITFIERLYGIGFKEALRKLNLDNSYSIKTNPNNKQFIEPEPDYTDPILLRKSLKKYDQNNFAIWLIKEFGNEKAIQLLKKFYVGTSKHWTGGNIFWQIDEHGKIRGGKVMVYNPKSGKRKKKFITWTHKIANQDYRLKQCLFGIHQISSDKKNKIVGIVESEKTAIIQTARFNSIIWLSCGGAVHLNSELLEPLKNRKIILYPDLKQEKNWRKKCKYFKSIGFNIILSNILTEIATLEERELGLDLADYEFGTLADKLYKEMNKKNPLLEKLVYRLDLELLKD